MVHMYVEGGAHVWFICRVKEGGVYGTCVGRRGGTWMVDR